MSLCFVTIQCMAPMSLPPGFRFHPTDEELTVYYLDRKVTGRKIELEIIPEIDLYKCEPWDLPEKSFLPSKDNEWYFYCQRDRKYPNGSRTNRATSAGYWKATGKDRTVQSQKRPVGMKKTLVYYRGRAPHGIRSNWVMHEYRLIDSIYDVNTISTLKDSYALCRVFKKTAIIPKAKEKITSHDSQEHDDLDYDQNIPNDFTKLPSDTSSSDITQGTPIENGTPSYDVPATAPFAASDEANSSADLYLHDVDSIEWSSNLFQNMQHYCPFQYPALALEDFPQINIMEVTNKSEPETLDEYMDFDKFYGSGTATLDEILSLCSSDLDLSVDLSMHG